MAALDLELVNLAFAEIGNEDLPDSGGSAVPHGMPAAVPVIEVAGHADTLGVGRPDGEVNSAEAFMGSQVGPQPLVVAEMRALAQKVKVEIGEHRLESIGIDELPAVCPSWFSTSSRYMNGSGRSVNTAWKKPVRVNSLHGNQHARLALQPDRPPRLADRASGRNARITQSLAPSMPSGKACRPRTVKGFQ